MKISYLKKVKLQDQKAGWGQFIDCFIAQIHRAER